MAQSIVKIQTQLMRSYYKKFSKYSTGKEKSGFVAWVTSFAPVEILDVFGISYYYPESYSAVIAASGCEQGMLSEAKMKGFSGDCCSYAACMEGALLTGEGPRGIPPLPDILIATNNQCNTLPNWWNMLATKYGIPLVVIDYPGEYVPREVASEYVNAQHWDLIKKLEKMTGISFDENNLSVFISNSAESVSNWKKLISLINTKSLKPTMLFDDITYLITSRSNELTAELYKMMYEEIAMKEIDENSKIPLYWIGYPLWYHEDRYFSEYLKDFKIVGSNYITWWNLDYSGNDSFNKLFNAYNFTFLNLLQKTRNRILGDAIYSSGAKCAISLHNKSCKCDFVSAREIAIPKIEIEMDMIDREFVDPDRVREQICLLKDIICTE